MTETTIKPPDLDNRFKKLFQSGKLVQVHVSKWSMTASATESDLGLDKLVVKEGEDKPEVPSFVTLGKKALFTEDVMRVFSKIESRARTYLLNHSHKFPVADAHFVPQKTLVTVLSELEEFKKSFLLEVNTFITNYEAYQEKMFTAYPAYKESLLPCYPSAEKAREKFDFSVSVYEVAFPKRMAKITVNDIIAQNLAAEKATEKYEAMMKEQYQHHLKQMQDFLKDTALSMRNEIIKTFETIALKIQNREVVSGANLNTIRSVIDSFDALDFMDDSKVKANLSIVKRLIGSGADFKSDQEALTRLSAAVNTTLETAKSMTDIDSITGEYTRRLDEEL